MTAQRSVVAPKKAKQTIRFPAWPIRLHAADLSGPKEAAEEAGLPAEPDVRDLEDLDSILRGWSHLGMDLGEPALVLEAAKRIAGSLPYEHNLLAHADTRNAEIMDDIEDAQEYLLELASTPWGGTAFWHPARDAGTLLNMAAAGDLEAETAWLAVGQRKQGGEWMLLGEAIRRLAVAAGIHTEPFILACHLMREVLLSNEFLQGQEAKAGSWPGCLGRPVRSLPTGLRKVVHEAEAFFQKFRLKVGGPLPARDESQHPRLLGWRTWLGEFWAGYRKRVVLVQTERSPQERREYIEAFMTERSKPGPYLQAQAPAPPPAACAAPEQPDLAQGQGQSLPQDDKMIHDELGDVWHTTNFRKLRKADQWFEATKNQAKILSQLFRIRSASANGSRALPYATPDEIRRSAFKRAPSPEGAGRRARKEAIAVLDINKEFSRGDGPRMLTAEIIGRPKRGRWGALPLPKCAGN